MMLISNDGSLHDNKALFKFPAYSKEQIAIDYIKCSFQGEFHQF